MQGTILRQFSYRDFDNLQQTCVNCGFTACSSSCKGDRSRTLILNLRSLLQPWSQCPGAMKEQQRYQTVTHHQHSRSEKTSGSYASVNSAAEASCRVIPQCIPKSHCFALGSGCSKPNGAIQTPLAGMQLKAWWDVIGTLIKDSPYSPVSPDIGPISLLCTLRWRDKVPSSEKQLERDELFPVFFSPWDKAVLWGPSKWECGEKGRHPTQHATRGNCSFIKRRAQRRSDISPRPRSQRLLNHSDCLWPKHTAT